LEIRKEEVESYFGGENVIIPVSEVDLIPPIEPLIIEESN
jgi:hypothetical protein